MRPRPAGRGRPWHRVSARVRGAVGHRLEHVAGTLAADPLEQLDRPQVANRVAGRDGPEGLGEEALDPLPQRERRVASQRLAERRAGQLAQLFQFLLRLLPGRDFGSPRVATSAATRPDSGIGVGRRCSLR